MNISKLLGLPELGSVHGKEVDHLILLVHYLMIALFIGWAGYFFYCLIRFRKGRNTKADHQGVTSHASNYLEGAVAVIEIILLVGFAVPLWAKVVDDFPKPEENPLNVRVTAKQFNWMARYPGTNNVFGKQDIALVTTANPLGLYQKDDKFKAQDPDGADDISVESSEMAVPVDRPVVTAIGSLDVIHSFKVLPLRITQDAIPGIRIPIHFKATKTNTYLINCAQLCGNGHSAMKGYLRVLPEDQFNAWLQGKASSSAASFE